eukprot:TRINITY_DN7891_c0_g1_i1.p1 TRINITY_DN7891_c0_g1~~TRINITY_DN7891_c0_g1_i1.p1  ORF type:complete len:227 (+),score=35.63 TRINITY_DN7891_c0_g1_i1:120-800(+)
MSFKYAIVARESIVLAEHAASGPLPVNLDTIVKKILLKAESHLGKKSIKYEQMMFHIYSESGLKFLVVTDLEMTQQRSFQLLQSISKLFFDRHSAEDIQSSRERGCQRFFGPVIQQQMEYLQSSRADTTMKIAAIHSEIDGVKEIMTDNINKVLARGDALEALEDKSEKLRLVAKKFEGQAKQLKCAMWIRNMKLRIIIVAIILVVVFFIVVGACGGFTFPRCFAR